MGRIKMQKCANVSCDKTFPKRSNKLFCGMNCRAQSFRRGRRVKAYILLSDLCPKCLKKAESS